MALRALSKAVSHTAEESLRHCWVCCALSTCPRIGIFALGTKANGSDESCTRATGGTIAHSAANLHHKVKVV